MLNNSHKFCSLLFIVTALVPSCSAQSIISTYLISPPANVIQAVNKELDANEAQKIIGNYLAQQQPGKISQKFVQGQLREKLGKDIGGFPTVYQGSFDYSNPNGHIKFILKHQSPRVSVLVTKRIKLDKIKGNTVSQTQTGNLIIDNGPQLDAPQSPAKMYLFERLQDKEEQYYWKVSKQEIPTDGKISPTTIVILTNPANIYVPLGDFLTVKNEADLILPNLYVVGTLEKEADVLSALQVKRFFQQETEERKQATDLITQEMLID